MILVLKLSKKFASLVFILDTIKFCGLKRSEFKVKCVVTGYNAVDNIFDFPVATCDSKNAAIEEFWQKVDDEHWFERM